MAAEIFSKFCDRWWATCDDNIEEIVENVRLWHPNSEDFRESSIEDTTAPGAEMACRVVRREIQREGQGGIVSAFRLAVQDRDFFKVVHILSAVWFGAPEVRGIMQNNGFSCIVDLLEEAPEIEEWMV